MKVLTRVHWYALPMVLILLFLLSSCSPKTEAAFETSDTTAVADDYASPELEDAWENGTLGDGRPPQDGIWTYQAIWMSKAFDDELNRTLNIDSAVAADPLPIAYLDFTGGDAYLGLFDFTMFLANGGPEQQMLWSSFDIMDSENHISAKIQEGDKNPRGYTSMEMFRKNDYDADADGEVDDLETLEINLYKDGKLVDSRNYYKTLRAPDEIAHTALLTGSYEDLQGGVYSLGQSDSRAPDRYRTCSNFLATQECWSHTLYSFKTPEFTFDYVLVPDEAGNDYLMMGEKAGFAYSRQADTLTVYATEGIFKLVKTK